MRDTEKEKEEREWKWAKGGATNEAGRGRDGVAHLSCGPKSGDRAGEDIVDLYMIVAVREV